MSLNLSDQDKTTLRVAAYGAVSLLSAAAAAGGSPHRIATDGSLALYAATGPVGHVLAEKSGSVKLSTKSVAALADQVLPALAESMALLGGQDTAEAANFRDTVLLALEAAIGKDEPGPAVREMNRKITEALAA
ncbi:hypothetical protein Afil01_27860 [Actinorhabdospora filicis]|uniref:D-alanyl-D-alanine carboxypeptidase n=1 Tax=Actinorhabdospora filicis TaxID=1785913 RepID=A0A9W6SLK5_9ACTN|nr:hypothetical protein [Actinorhabdospora filicis]GLZ77979.1 hypothetical protein Afil01_27860 [Actinorhabdospora filicis]